MTEYKRLDEEAWSKFGKKLLAEKGSEKQKEFLQICRSGKDDFLGYMDEYLLSLKDGTIDGEYTTLEYKFAEREFLYPPKDTQEFIWNAFKNIPEEMMYCCGFWGYIVIDMIKSEYIKPDYLASELNSVTKTGIYVIDVALTSNDQKQIDHCARRILRSMCNPVPRGKRVVFSDFYLGKAYWRFRWADKMSQQNIGLNFDQILEIFDEKYYVEFSAKMHSWKSYIGSKNVFGGLLMYLNQEKGNKIPGKKLGKIIDKVSYISAWKAIEEQTPSINQTEIQKISEIL